MPKKCASLSLRGIFEGSLSGTALASAKNQRYLGVLKKNNLMWSLNCNTRLNKAWQAFYFLKRNISKIASWKTKLKAYTGYVPVVAYASQVWYASKGDMKALERLQRKVTLWIMNYPLNKTYEERLQLNLLPLWFYFELHDLLFLLDIFVNKYDYDFPEQIRGVVTMTRQGKKTSSL